MHFSLIIIAGVISFLIGAIWYTILFGKVWMKELGITEEEIKEKGNGTIQMVFSLFFEILVSFLVIYSISRLELPIFIAGILLSSIAVFSSLKNYIFELKSLKLILINESYKVICIMIMSTFYYFFR